MVGPHDPGRCPTAASFLLCTGLSWLTSTWPQLTAACPQSIRSHLSRSPWILRTLRLLARGEGFVTERAKNELNAPGDTGAAGEGRLEPAWSPGPVTRGTGGRGAPHGLRRNTWHVLSPQEMISARTHDTSPHVIHYKMAQSQVRSWGAIISQQESRRTPQFSFPFLPKAALLTGRSFQLDPLFGGEVKSEL